MVTDKQMLYYFFCTLLYFYITTDNKIYEKTILNILKPLQNIFNMLK